MKIKQIYNAFVRGVFGHNDERKNVDTMSDIDVLKRAHELFCAYRVETLDGMNFEEGRAFVRKTMPTVVMLEYCINYYANK